MGGGRRDEGLRVGDQVGGAHQRRSEARRPNDTRGAPQRCRRQSQVQLPVAPCSLGILDSEKTSATARGGGEGSSDAPEERQGGQGLRDADAVVAHPPGLVRGQRLVCARTPCATPSQMPPNKYAFASKG